MHPEYAPVKGLQWLAARMTMLAVIVQKMCCSGSFSSPGAFAHSEGI
jgi:hypothetical protein